MKFKKTLNAVIIGALPILFTLPASASLDNSGYSNITSEDVKKEMERLKKKELKITPYEIKLGNEYLMLRSSYQAMPGSDRLVTFLNASLYLKCGYALPIEKLMKTELFDHYLKLMRDIQKAMEDKTPEKELKVQKAQEIFDTEIANPPCPVKSIKKENK